jgi:MoaA/NifB/PqqE/SkfB family radical SAM enzyme
LLHPGLTDILKLVRKHDVAVLLSTNGQCLGNEGVIEALTSEPPTHLIVSIDGLTDETNSQYRIGAKLSRVLSGVRRITEIKESKKQSLPVLQMRFIVMRHNQHEVPRVIDFARRHRFDLLTFRTLSTVDSDVANRTHRDLVPDDPRFTGFTPDSGGPPPRRRFVCNMPFWFPTLFADGTVVACEQDYNAQEPLGVVSQQVSFTDVWFSKRAARVRTAIRDHAQRFTFCRNCPYKNRQSTDASFSMQLLNKQVDFSHWR